MNEKSLEFEIRTIFGQVAFDKALSMSPAHLKIFYSQTRKAFIYMLSIATQNDKLDYLPDNTFTHMGAKWQKVKEHSRILRKIFGLRVKEIWRVLQYPEIKIPEEFAGEKFVSFRQVGRKL